MKKNVVSIFASLMLLFSLQVFAQNQNFFFQQNSIFNDISFEKALQCVFSQETLTCIDAHGTVFSVTAEGLKNMIEKFFVCNFVKKNSYPLAFGLVFAHVLVNKGIEYGKKIMFREPVPVAIQAEKASLA